MKRSHTIAGLMFLSSLLLLASDANAWPHPHPGSPPAVCFEETQVMQQSPPNDDVYDAGLYITTPHHPTSLEGGGDGMPEDYLQEWVRLSAELLCEIDYSFYGDQCAVVVYWITGDYHAGGAVHCR